MDQLTSIVELAKDKMVLEALQGSDSRSFHAQRDTSITNGTTEDLSHEGFPVHVVPSGNTQILNPPCEICANLNPDYFDIKGNDGVAMQLIDQKKLNKVSSTKCFSCRLLMAIHEPYKDAKKFGYSYLRHKSKDLTHPGLEFSTDNPTSQKITVEVCVPEGTTCPWPSAFHRPLMWDTAIASRQILTWLQECSSSHKGCDHSSLPGLPTRLIEIRGPQRVRLYVSEPGERASYACLSHCWGGVVPIQLTHATLAEFQREIPWDELPRTFQDAVNMTTGLGLKFLWIDSLCIVQGDAEDWRRESGLMASVYSQAHITFAASQAADSTEGLFGKLGHSKYKKLYTGTSSQGEGYKIFIRTPLRTIETRRLPLLQRAWFFQERLLSPRIVYFSESFLYLKCAENLVAADQNAIYSNYDYRSNITKHNLEDGRKSHWETWHKIVEDYSSLSLTYPKDVFPALQGITKSIYMERQCEYYAGIWGDNIMIDLQWRRPKPLNNAETLPYQAPTWSWASRLGQVSWTISSDFTADAICVSISTTPAGSDPLGEITAGTITLEGCCLPAVLKEQMAYKRHRLLMQLKDGTTVESPWWPDVHPHSLLDKNVVVMRMGQQLIPTQLDYYLVLMRNGPDMEEYQRVGTMGHTLWESRKGRIQDSFVKHGERKVVVIV